MTSLDFLRNDSSATPTPQSPAKTTNEGEKLSVQCFKAKGPSKGTLLFLSGFPDTHNTFRDTLVPTLSKEYRCIVACLPDFDKPALGKTFGYSPQEIVERLDRTVTDLAPDGLAALVLHDWGSVYGLAWYRENHGRAEKLVCLDVFGDDVVLDAWENSWRDLAYVCAYQWWLMMAFAAGCLVPWVGDLLMGLLAISPLSPDKAPPPPGVLCPPHGPRWFMCYPYLHEWAARCRGRRPNRRLGDELAPTLYAFGLRKRVQFHSKRAVAALANDPRHRVRAYDCGHWLQHAVPEELSLEILDFLATRSNAETRVERTTAAPEAA